MNISKNDIQNYLKENSAYELIGNLKDSSSYIFSSLENSDRGSIIWVSPSKENKEAILKESVFALAVVDFVPKNIEQEKCYLVTKNPRETYFSLLAFCHSTEKERTISSHSVVSKKCKIGRSFSLGNFCTLGACTIGDNVTIENNVTIHDGVIIGDNTIIKSGVVIGGQGYGFQRLDNNELFSIPHIGNVVIGKNVYIGSNTCIDRGTLGNTIIGDGTKIDNLVHIAHNCKIGKNSLIIANAMIAGSTSIGDNCWVAPSVNTMEGTNIGNNVTIGICSLARKEIPDNETWVGIPAKKLR